ncbi:MAG TPA: barstar family protein [Jatrophihabitantaceae bacterium]|jgi:hypothetical protein
MTTRDVAPAATKPDAIRAIYVAVEAPDWAAPNLDALIDVLRDLSWLPPGPVRLRVPADLPVSVAEALDIAVTDTADTDRPVTVGRYPGCTHG